VRNFTDVMDSHVVSVLEYIISFFVIIIYREIKRQWIHFVLVTDQLKHVIVSFIFQSMLFVWCLDMKPEPEENKNNTYLKTVF